MSIEFGAVVVKNGCKDGNLTLESNTALPVPVAVCVNLRDKVCPSCIFDVLILVEPLGNVKVKKLPVEQSSDAVFDTIVKLLTSPTTEPLNVSVPIKVFEPVVAYEPVTEINLLSLLSVDCV